MVNFSICFFGCLCAAWISSITLVTAYYRESPDNIDWKWWLKYPELHEEVSRMRGHKYLKDAPNYTTDDIVKTLISTNTHIYGIQGTGVTMKLRRENLRNFSTRFGFTGRGHQYIDVISKTLKDLSNIRPKLNSDHRGRVTCAEGHLEVFRKFLASNYSSALVFEDDVVEIDGFTAQEISKLLVHSLNMFQKRKWDVLFLGYCFAANKTLDENLKIISIPKDKLFVKSCASHCTHAYMVNRLAAKIYESEISNKFLEISATGIDTMFGDLINYFGKSCNH